MITLKLRDQDSVEVRIELDKKHREFDSILSVVKTIPGRYYDRESYAWVIPKANARLLCDQIDHISRIGFLSRESEIFGEPTKPVLPDFQVKDDFLDELALPLYPYQKVGACFLHDIEKAIIGDDMGLGKSPTMMAAIWRLYREQKIKQALLMVPTSVLYQWGDELEKFLPQATYIIIDGTVAKRKKIYQKIEQKQPLFCLIGHEMMRNDIEILDKKEWGVVAIDEGHRIRNYNSQLTKAAKRLKAPYRFIATGTPIQNRPEEIWSLFDFIDPTVFGNWFYFRKKYVILGEKFGARNVVVGYTNLDDLYNRINSRMLRRLKEDVGLQLPRLLINTHKLEMTPTQQRLHRMIQDDLDELISTVEKYREYDSEGNITREHPAAASVMGLFTMLQEVADTPELLLLSDSKIADGYKQYCDSKSNKLEELKEIVRDQLHYNNDLKMIIFSQYERMQQILVRELSRFGKCICLNGKMSPQEKIAAQRLFREDPEIMFFISSDAGNYGINLAVANVVVNADVPWNPATWRQRYARAHRIGNTHANVNVINLISLESIDESIYNTMYNRSLNADMLTDRDIEERRILAEPNNANIRRLIARVQRVR